VSTVAAGATVQTSAIPLIMPALLISHAASLVNMPGGAFTPVPLTYVSFTLKGPNKGVMLWPGHRNQILGLLFLLPDCRFLLLDQ
jgi:hypothetical protein